MTLAPTKEVSRTLNPNEIDLVVKIRRVGLRTLHV